MRSVPMHSVPTWTRWRRPGTVRSRSMHCARRWRAARHCPRTPLCSPSTTVFGACASTRYRSSRERGWPFTVFLVSGLTGCTDVWTRGSNPDGRTYPLLDADEILDMQRRGVSFHSHTRSHASLPLLDDGNSSASWSTPDRHSSRCSGREVSYLAYPFGRVDERVVAATRKAGYRAAFSTQPGFNRSGVDRYRIRRIDVYGPTPGDVAAQDALRHQRGRTSTLLRYYAGRFRARLFAPRLD